MEPPRPATLSAVKVKLSRCLRASGACRRRAHVTVTASPGAGLTILLERKLRSAGRARWVKLTYARAAAGGAATTLPRALRAGRYRVTVTAAAGASKRTAFRVRG
jgi:hypothetical protein